MQKQIENLLVKIKDDYINWTTAGGTKELSGYFKESVEKWDDTIQIKEGQKYIKIIRDKGVWGFIAKEDFVSKGKVFNKGDILKAAGWQAPARNAARGNIYDDDYYVQWTGPLYLK